MHRNTKYSKQCLVEEVQIHQYRNCLRRDMQKALMTLSSSPKSKTIKTGNQLNGYVSNFAHDQKYKTKITFAFILKESFFIFKVKEFSFYF